MAEAIRLAEGAWGSTAPNPAVGCLIVEDGEVIGRGATAAGGRPHAEALALLEAGPRAGGATAYLSMEPCAHEDGRGPPCARLLVQSGIARAVVARADPSERNRNRGLELMREAGIEVVLGVAADRAAPVTAGWEHRLTHGRPRVTLKLALSIDGRIAHGSGESRWLTAEPARAHAHMERARADMIIVGRGTLETDDPELTVRLAGEEHRSPRPGVLTATLDRIPAHHRLAERDPMILARPEAVDTLALNDILLEGGAQAATAFLRADRVDRLLIYRAPILLGNDGLPATGFLQLDGLAEAHGRWTRTHTEAIGPDLLEIYRRLS